MDLNEIVKLNYLSAINRGQITNKTRISDILDKLDEEVAELKQSHTLNDTFDIKELADVVLVCTSLAIFEGVDLLKAMEEKAIYNSQRKD